jgi:hypothetical protein
MRWPTIQIKKSGAGLKAEEVFRDVESASCGDTIVLGGVDVLHRFARPKQRSGDGPTGHGNGAKYAREPRHFWSLERDGRRL